MSLKRKLLNTTAATVLGAVAVGCQSIGVSMTRGVEEYIEIQHFSDHSETNHVLKVVDKEDYNIIGKTGNALYYGIQGIGNGFQKGMDRYKAYRAPNDDDEDTALIEFMETCQSAANVPIDGFHKIMPAILEGFISGMGRGWRLHKGDEDQEIIYNYILEKRLQDRERRRLKLDYKPEVEVRHTGENAQEIVIDTEYFNDDNITTDHIIKTIDVYEDIQNKNMPSQPAQDKTKTESKDEAEKAEPQKISTQSAVSIGRVKAALEHLPTYS